MTANRKERALRNLGGTTEAAVQPFFDGPPQAESRTSIVMVERVLLDVLRTEIERLRNDRVELTRIFRHLFDPTTGNSERDGFVDSFIKQPPVTVLGYPRLTTEMPCFAVILESESESTTVLGDYLGQTLEGEVASETAEYLGAVFESVFGVYIYAGNPDVCAYLYQFAKMCLFGAKIALEQSGLIEPSFSGGELSPEEMYLPDNMFARVLRITTKSVMSVPRLFPYRDGRDLRVTGIFREDVVVDGIAGGVTTNEPT